MSKIGNIVKGTLNNLVGNEEELFTERIKICRQCKLLKTDTFFGEMCNNKLYLNPVTDELSYVPQFGYYRGCGCILESKTRVPSERCPLNKW